MRFLTASTLLALAGEAHAASSWTFSDGTVTVASRAADNVVEKYVGAFQHGRGARPQLPVIEHC